MTRTESINGSHKSEWVVDRQLTEIIEVQKTNSVVRRFSAEEPKMPLSFYSSLKFKCTFPDLKTLSKSDVTRRD